MIILLKLTVIVAMIKISPINAINIFQLPSIGHASVDKTTMTVSGLSSGGFMTTMLHYMYSSKFKAGGVFAGGPFDIAYNISDRDFLPEYALNLVIVELPVVGRSASDLEAQAISYADQGLIDPLSNLNGSKAYVYQGDADPVNPIVDGNSQKAIDMYTYFGSDVQYLNLVDGTHCVPTNNYGGPCPIFDPIDDGVNNCGIESIFAMFSHFFETNYIAPRSSSTRYTGTLYNFDQNPYAPSRNAATDFMNGSGGIYIPLACQNTEATCKLHVALHGCFQSVYADIISDVFATRTGYLQIADTNNIIVVFPRAAPMGLQFPDEVSASCWDWFGLTTTITVPFKQMPQVKSIANILNAVIGTTVF